jgi:hypothetical protein
LAVAIHCANALRVGIGRLCGHRGYGLIHFVLVLDGIFFLTTVFKCVVKSNLMRFAIVAAILLQLMLALQYRNYSYPIGPQQADAIRAYQANPSEPNRVVMLQKMHCDVIRNSLPDNILFGVIVLADAVVFYFFWNHRAKNARVGNPTAE